MDACGASEDGEACASHRSVDRRFVVMHHRKAIWEQQMMSNLLMKLVVKRLCLVELQALYARLCCSIKMMLDPMDFMHLQFEYIWCILKHAGPGEV